MFYPFPYIKHIDQVREALQGREEFIISEKPLGFTVANYLVNFEDTFPKINIENQNFASKEDELHAIRRECRGIKFDTKTGLVIARPFHKFFNVNEREETQVKDVLVNATWMLEKLDGSMIHPIPTTDGIHWCTKMGVTEVSIPVEQFVKEHPEYIAYAQYCIDNNWTPIFEWCSRKQRIVVDHPKDQLILTAIRENYSGRYLSLSEMEATFYKVHGIVVVNTIPMVKSYSKYDLINLKDETDSFRLEENLGKTKTDDGLIDLIRNKENVEGYVFRFHDGHMLKAKCDWYLRIHKAKDCLAFEKDVIEAIVNEKIDDVKPYLMQSDLVHINEFQTAFWSGFQKTVHLLGDLYDTGKEFAGDDKKKFATEYVAKQEPKFKPLLFQMWNGEPGAKIPAKATHTILLDLIKKKLGSSTMVEEVRWIFNANWSYSTANE